MSILKKLILIVFSLLLCISLSPHVYALNGVNDHQTGSIELAFEDSQTSHISFSLYKIGDVIDGSYVQYVPSMSFSKLDFDLNNISTSKDYETIINQCLTLINKNNIHSLKTINGNSDGNVIFDDLEFGMYFIKQDEKVKGFESECLIVTVPFNTGDGLMYDVIAKPKYDKEVQPTDHKQPIVHVNTSDDTDIVPVVVTLLISGCFVLLIYLFIKHDKKSGS